MDFSSLDSYEHILKYIDLEIKCEGGDHNRAPNHMLHDCPSKIPMSHILFFLLSWTFNSQLVTLLLVLRLEHQLFGIDAHVVPFNGCNASNIDSLPIPNIGHCSLKFLCCPWTVAIEESNKRRVIMVQRGFGTIIVRASRDDIMLFWM